MVFGVGSIIGPLVSGFTMALIGTSGLFMTSLGAHILIGLYTIWGIAQRAPVAMAEKGTYVSSPPARASTPETAAMQVK